MGNVYLTNATTGQGKAKYFKVNTAVDIFEGKETGYVAHLYLGKKETQELIAFVDKAIADAKESKEFMHPKTGKPVNWRTNPRVPYKTDDDGNVYFVFKKSHLDKEGNRQYVPMQDSQNNPLKNNIAIGNDSIVQICYTPNVYHKNEDVNGVKFFLNSIRIIKLETFANNPFGDAVEGGYVAESPAADNNDGGDEIPF